jgi:hypothetical protein
MALRWTEVDLRPDPHGQENSSSIKWTNIQNPSDQGRQIVSGLFDVHGLFVARVFRGVGHDFFYLVGIARQSFAEKFVAIRRDEHVVFDARA